MKYKRNSIRVVVLLGILPFLNSCAAVAQIGATAKTEQGKAIAATGNEREIEVELEVVSSNATRIRTVAKQGFFFKDRATATEIILQTEKVLGVS